MAPLLFIGSIGIPETIVILVVGLLIFGSRLPEVGRSMGRGLMEFRKGLKGFQDEVHGIDREADRAIDDELARRRAAASEHELADDPRGSRPTSMPWREEVSDPQPDADPMAPRDSDFVPGDPAREEVLGPRAGFGAGHADSEEFVSPDVPPRIPNSEASDAEAAPEPKTPGAPPANTPAKEG